MGGGSTPPAPDYEEAARATSDGNLELAQYTTAANRANQTNPWGSVNWSKTGGEEVFDQAGYDAAMAGYNEQFANWQAGGRAIGSPGGNMESFDNGYQQLAPVGSEPEQISRHDFTTRTPENWTQSTTLTPELQRALESQIGLTVGRSDLASSLLERVKQSYSQPFNAPKLNDYLKNVQDIDQSALKSSDYTSGVPGLNYDAPDLEQYMKDIPGLDYNTPEAQAYFKDVLGVNQNGPQFDPSNRDAYSKAAFDASDSLLSRKYASDEQSLRDSLALQGLNPMSQANSKATGSFLDSKNA